MDKDWIDEGSTPGKSPLVRDLCADCSPFRLSDRWWSWGACYRPSAIVRWGLMSVMPAC